MVMYTVTSVTNKKEKHNNKKQNKIQQYEQWQCGNARLEF